MVTGPERATNEIVNPAYQNLPAQLNEVKTEIKIREDQRKWIEQQIARYSSRVQRTPQLLIILFGVFGSLGLGLAMAFGADGKTPGSPCTGRDP